MKKINGVSPAWIFSCVALLCFSGTATGQTFPGAVGRVDGFLKSPLCRSYSCVFFPSELNMRAGEVTYSPPSRDHSLWPYMLKNHDVVVDVWLDPKRVVHPGTMIRIGYRVKDIKSSLINQVYRNLYGFTGEMPAKQLCQPFENVSSSREQSSDGLYNLSGQFFEMPTPWYRSLGFSSVIVTCKQAFNFKYLELHAEPKK